MKFSEKELLYLTNASGEKLLTSIFDFDDTDEEFERCYDLKKLGFSHCRNSQE